MTDIKLASFNTSWVNDCHNSQLNDFLSESASIMAKGKYLIDQKDTVALLDEDAIKRGDYTFSNIRKKFGERATQWVQKCMDNEFHFIALIEQIIHVSNKDPNHSHAYYPTTVDYNLEKHNAKNEDYGILKRLKALSSGYALSNDIKSTNLVENVSIGYEKNEYNYGCVFDNVMNTDINAGEGIAIIFKKNLVDTILSWSSLNIPNKTNYATYKNMTLNNKDKFENNDITVNYFSADLGTYLCTPQTNYVTSRGTRDLGRPFIMAGGIKDNFLNIFIAFHGLNLTNIKKNINNTPTNLSDNEKIQLIEDLLIKIKELIQEALNTLTDKSVLSEVQKINIFMGCDSNEPNGVFVTKISDTIFELTINNKQFEVNFKIDDKPPLTCCANCNSVTQDTTPVCKPTGNLDQDRYTAIQDNKIYHPDFYIPDNFKFTGDYVLYGTSDTDFKPKKLPSIDIYKKSEIYYKNDEILISDHYPVSMIIESQSLLSGGKSRRKVTKKMKHKNMKHKTRKNKTRKYKTRKH